LEDLLNNLTALFAGHKDEEIKTYHNICKNSWEDKLDNQCLLAIARTNSTKAGAEVHQATENAHETYLRGRKLASVDFIYRRTFYLIFF